MSNESTTVTINPTDNGWQYATGEIPISMTNDFLFCTMLEKNNAVLKSLICALLNLPPEELQTAEIRNPISSGHTKEDKTIILDVKVLLNQNTILNLELQVMNEHNWPERSIYYLCRCFDNLEHGDNYVDVKPAIHISILGFTLFPKDPEFYATYYMMNEKTHKLYSDKFRISVLCLNQIEKATEEDKVHHIDYWAQLFKCKNWRELQMLANSDDNIKEAVSTVYQLTQDERIRFECQQREEALRRMNTDKILAAEAKEKLDKTTEKLLEKETLLSKVEVQLSETESQLSKTKAQLSEQNEQLQKQAALIHELERKLQKQKDNASDSN